MTRSLARLCIFLGSLALASIASVHQPGRQQAHRSTNSHCPHDYFCVVPQGQTQGRCQRLGDGGGADQSIATDGGVGVAVDGVRAPDGAGSQDSPSGGLDQAVGGFDQAVDGLVRRRSRAQPSIPAAKT